MASQPRTTEENINRPNGDAMVVDSDPHEQDAVPKQERASTPPRATASLMIPNGTPSSSRVRESVSPSKAGLNTPLRKVQTASISTPRTPTPMGVPPERVKPPETTREMLSHIAWLTEELQRASREKVNLAKAATDSVGLQCYGNFAKLVSHTLSRWTDISVFLTKQLKSKKQLFLWVCNREHIQPLFYCLISLFRDGDDRHATHTVRYLAMKVVKYLIKGIMGTMRMVRR